MKTFSQSMWLWRGAALSRGALVGIALVVSQSSLQAQVVEVPEPKPGVVSTNKPALAIDGEMQGLQQARPKVEADSHIQAWDVGWDKGFHYSLRLKEVPDRFTLWRAPLEYRRLEGRMGAKLHIDAAMYDADDTLPPISDEIDLRRGRIYTLGNTHFFKPMDYKVEFGFAGSKFFFNEGYARWNEVPWVKTIQMGQFKAPMSMEMLGGSGATTFMERGLPVLAFAPGSRLGLQFGGPFIEQHMTLVAGAFANVADLDVGDATESALGAMARFTWAPVLGNTEGVNSVLHIGVSSSYTQSRKDSFRYRARPESHIAPHLVDTGDIEGADAVLSGIELAGVAGPLSLQGEALHSLLSQSDGDRLEFLGFYGQASWFFTGETRQYNARRGVFSRIDPKTDVSWKKGQWGAWEVAARGSVVDLSEKAIRGGRIRDVTLGLNWYWSRDIRVMINYVYSDVDQKLERGTVQTVQTRLQLEF